MLTHLGLIIMVLAFGRAGFAKCSLYRTIYGFHHSLRGIAAKFKPLATAKELIKLSKCRKLAIIKCKFIKTSSS